MCSTLSTAHPVLLLAASTTSGERNLSAGVQRAVTVGVPLAAAALYGRRAPAHCLAAESSGRLPPADVRLHAHQALFGRFFRAAAEEVRLHGCSIQLSFNINAVCAAPCACSPLLPAARKAESLHVPRASAYHCQVRSALVGPSCHTARRPCCAQVFTLLRGVYLYLLFLPAVASAPVCMGLGVGREAWLLLMRWTLERAGPVRRASTAPAGEWLDVRLCWVVPACRAERRRTPTPPGCCTRSKSTSTKLLS